MNPYSAPRAGPLRCHAHSSGMSATSASGPQSSAGNARARSSPEATAADRARQEWVSAARRAAHSQSRQRSFSPRASWLSGFTRKHDRQRNSSARRGTTRADAVTRLVGLEILVLELVRLLLEAIGGGALVQEHVERLLDVVGVQLLLEVDDVVVLVLGALVDRRFVPAAGTREPPPRRVLLDEARRRPRPSTSSTTSSSSTRSSSPSRSTSSSSSGSSSSNSSSSSGHHGLFGARGTGRPGALRARTIAPRVRSLGRTRVRPGIPRAPERTAGGLTPCGERREMVGPRRPLGPLFGPAGRADGLFQRSLLGLLDPQPRLSAATPPVPSRTAEVRLHGEQKTQWVVSQTEPCPVKRQRAARGPRDLRRRASVQVTRAEKKFACARVATSPRTARAASRSARRGVLPRRVRTRAARARRPRGPRSSSRRRARGGPASSAIEPVHLLRDVSIRRVTLRCAYAAR